MDKDLVVLITGGAGFLGQHIIRELQLRHPRIQEIRVLDLKPYHNFLNHDEPKPLKSIIGNITDKPSMQDAFQGVDCVFHCAAFVSYEYPPNYDELHKVNVQGTKNVISLCQENDVKFLVFASTAEVTFSPYLGRLFITVIINQTEQKAVAPVESGNFNIPGYAVSKYDAETLVLTSNGLLTKNGSVLKTIAVRPTLMYGEEDPSFLTKVMAMAYKMGGKIPRIAGAGGKQQVVYAGNAAWGHVCAMDTLMKKSEQMAGLPVFITDDTPIIDVTRTCQRLSKEDNGRSLCKPTWWSIPLSLTIIISVIVQTFSKVLNIKMQYSPVALLSYFASFIFFNSMRASIRMGYSPVYSSAEATKLSSNFYTKYYKGLGDSEALKKRI